jgi:hypothetical protein
LSGARTPSRGGTSAVDLAAEAFKMYKSSPSHGEGDIPPKFRKAGAIFHHSLFSDLRALGVMGHVKQWPVVVSCCERDVDFYLSPSPNEPVCVGTKLPCTIVIFYFSIFSVSLFL